MRNKANSYLNYSIYYTGEGGGEGPTAKAIMTHYFHQSVSDIFHIIVQYSSQDFHFKVILPPMLESPLQLPIFISYLLSS